MKELLTSVFFLGTDEIDDTEIEKLLGILGIESSESEGILDEVENSIDTLVRIWKHLYPTDDQPREELLENVSQELLNSTYWQSIASQLSTEMDSEHAEFESDENELSAIIYVSKSLHLDIPLTKYDTPIANVLSKIYDRMAEIATESDDEIIHIVDDQDSDGDLEISAPLRGQPNLSWTVGKLLEGIEEEEIDFPLWQRKGDAWSLTKKRNLIRSMLVGIPLPTMIMHQRSDGVMEVIDGRQRLTALQSFMNDEFKTASFKNTDQPMTAATATPHGFDLQAYSSKKFSEISDVSITDANGVQKKIKRHIEQAQVPLLIFDNLTPQQLYFIFTVYNTNSTPLNDAEIRNAVYHEHPLHRLLMDLSGDSEPIYKEVDGKKVRDWPYPKFTPGFRRLLSPKDGEPKRFKAVSFLARYLAYTLPAGAFRGNGRLVKDSNKKHIHHLMEDNWDLDPNKMAGLVIEISNAVNFCNNIHAKQAGYQPYHTKTKSGKYAFNGVKAIASLAAAGIMIASQVEYSLTVEQLKKVITSFEKNVPFPEKQYAGPTWGYHLGVIAETRRVLAELEADPMGLSNGRFDKLIEESEAHMLELATMGEGQE